MIDDFTIIFFFKKKQVFDIVNEKLTSRVENYKGLETLRLYLDQRLSEKKRNGIGKVRQSDF